MTSRPRTATSILILWAASVLFSLCVIAIAGRAAGDGTLVVDLGEDVIAQEDNPVTLTPMVSYTGSSPSLSYSWDFGDGTTGSTERPVHVYTKSDDYTVTLTVDDNDGVQASDSMTVTVLNVRPIADAGANRTIVEGSILRI